jgi:uncharacterized protein YbjT (DUF2867 family)
MRRHANCVLPTASCVLQRGYKVRALTRKPDKTKQLFSNHPNLEVGAALSSSKDESTKHAGELYS